MRETKIENWLKAQLQEIVQFGTMPSIFRRYVRLFHISGTITVTFIIQIYILLYVSKILTYSKYSGFTEKSSPYLLPHHYNPYYHNYNLPESFSAWMYQLLLKIYQLIYCLLSIVKKAI